MLEVGIHADDSIACGVVNAGDHSCFMSEIPGETDHPDGASGKFLFPESPDGFRRAVGTSIVDKEKLPIPGVVPGQFPESGEQSGQRPLFVKYRKSDGYFPWFRHGLLC
jgi:hypothetical protein